MMYDATTDEMRQVTQYDVDLMMSVLAEAFILRGFMQTAMINFGTTHAAIIEALKAKHGVTP